MPGRIITLDRALADGVTSDRLRACADWNGESSNLARRNGHSSEARRLRFQADRLNEIADALDAQGRS